MEQIFQWISQYGYAGLFALLMVGIVGLPVPDETLLVFCGYLISRGAMNPLAAWLTASAGSMCGITLSYGIGRAVGFPFVHRFGRYVHLTDERLVTIQNWFDRMGHWLLTFGYFIPGVRHLTALVAGMSRLQYRHFALFAYAGAGLWAATFLGLGWALGDKWRQVFDRIHRNLTLATVVAVAVLIAFWYWRSRPRSAK